jgi:hypothetical protein
MSEEIVKLTCALERKLTVIHELTAELSACRAALVGMDLETIYVHIERQTALCEQLRAAEMERQEAWQAVSASAQEPVNDGTLSSWIRSLEPESGARLRKVLTGLAVAEGEMRHVSRVHTILLDGTQRTLKVLANAMGTLSPLYAPPPPLESFADVRRRA